jgi:Rieske Fe-S protein
MPCEHCLNRRDFLARTAGGAAIAAIVACGNGRLSGPNSITRVDSTVVAKKFSIVVSQFPELAAVGRLVQVGAFQAAKRTATSPAAFEAFSMACTHAGCLTEIVNAQRFDCPCHGSKFAADGSVINGPFTGEHINPLQKLATSYDPATDTLTIG